MTTTTSPPVPPPQASQATRPQRPPQAGQATPPQRPPQAGQATRPQRPPAPGPEALPRTSVQHPWDRVRFAGPAHPVGAKELGETEAGSPVPTDLPEPGPWAAAVVRAAVETLLGLRPAAQLARWLDADLYDRLARRAGLAIRMHGRPRAARPTTIRSVRVCAVRDGVREATVVLHDGQRVRAAAVRLETHRGRWRATALEIG